MLQNLLSDYSSLLSKYRVHALFVPLLLVVLSVPIPRVMAQSGTPKAGDVEAIDALRVLGQQSGIAAVAATNFQLTGTVTIHRVDSEESFPFTVTSMGMERAKWEIHKPDGIRTTIIDRGSGVRAKGQGRTPLPVHRISGNGLEAFPILALGYWLRDGNIRIENSGITNVGGRQLFKMDVIRSHPGDPPDEFARLYEKTTKCELYLDPATGFPVLLRYFRFPRSRSRGIPMDFWYEDIQQVRGIVMPMTAKLKVGTTLLKTIRIESAQVNLGITRSAFRLE